MKKMRYLIILIIIAGLLSGCANMKKSMQGALIGSGLGGAIGGLIGKRTGHTTAGILIGAAIGGSAGAAIGHYMDKQAAELKKDLANAKVERVGEGIKITFDSGILFGVNSSKLQSAAKENISSLSKVLQKYDDTKILIQGHTDASGSDEHNQKLSEQRAESVARYAMSQGVQQVRFSVLGYGEEKPIATNDTEVGRRENRRVEVAIFANDKLKKEAEKGNI